MNRQDTVTEGSSRVPIVASQTVGANVGLDSVGTVVEL